MSDRTLGRTMRAQLGRVRQSTTRWQVYAQMRADIMNLSLAPGRAVSEAELAEVYGVSRTPIREALIRLTEDHLIEVVPQLGSFVTRISTREVTDVHFIRVSLEVATLAGIAERMTDDDVSLLEDLLTQERLAAERGDLAAWFAADEELHYTLQQIGDHTRTWSVIGWAKAHMDRVRILANPDAERLESMRAQHAALVESLAAKDVAAAERILVAHLGEVLELLGPLVREHPAYFDEAPAGSAYSGVSAARSRGRRRTASGQASGTSNLSESSR